MKKSAFIAAFAAGLLGLAACSEQEVTTAPEAPEAGNTGFTVRATVDATRTSVDNYAVSWDEGDNMSILINNGQKDELYEFTWTGKGDLFSSESFTPSAGVNYIWYALFPYDSHFTSLNDDYSSAYVNIPAKSGLMQKAPGDMSHLANMPLYGYAETKGDKIPEIKMHHLTSVIQLSIANNLSEDLDISSIGLDNNSGALLSGTFYVNCESGEILKSDTETQQYTFTDVTLGLTDGTVKAGETGVFYIPVAAATINPGKDLVFTITDNNKGKAVITKNLVSGLTFNPGRYRRTSITIDSNTEFEGPAQYSLYTGDLVEDDYIVVYDNRAMKAAVSSNRLSYEKVEPSDNVITSFDESIVWHIAKSGNYWTIYNSAEKKYAASNGTKNQAQLLDNGTDDMSLWTVTPSSGAFDFVNKSNAAAEVNSNLRNNGTYGFACYSSSIGGALSLYRKGMSSGIAFSEDSYTLTLGSNDYSSFTGQALINPKNVNVSYSSSNEGVAAVASDGTVTLKGGVGSTTITASFAGDGSYFASAVSYVVTVISEYDFTTVAELNALAADNAGEVTGTLSNAVVSYVPGANDAIIKDATGSILYHKKNHGLKQGQTYTGEATVNATLYNGVCEITSLVATFVGEQAVVEPEVVSLSSISDYDTWQAAYVKVENLVVASVSGKNVYVQNGEGTYLVYSNPGNATCAAGDIITVIGTVTKYNNNPQIKVWSADNIIINQGHQIANHAVTFTQPEKGGSFTVSANGAQISSGTELEEGTVVTLTATAAEGYTFSGWTVTGATVSGNTETATFTVGTEDVVVSASFVAGTNITLQYTGSTTGNFGTDNVAATVGLSASDWSVIAAKGSASNNVGYNKDGDIRLYYHASGSNTLTVSSLTNATINYITIEYTGSGYSNGKVLVGGNVVTASDGSYPINSTSFVITNGNTSNVQVRIKKIVINYTANN